MEGKDFYFQMMTNDDKSVVFLITPKKFYDTEGCLLDVAGAATEILPRGFREIQPSFFKYEGQTVDIGKEMLQTVGMIEINFGLTSVKPNKPREHEEDMEDVEEEHFEHGPGVNHGPRVEEEDYDNYDNEEEDVEDEPEPEENEEEHIDDDEFRENPPRVEGEHPVIIPKIGNLNLGPNAFENTNQPIQNPPPTTGAPSRPLTPVVNASNDLDDLIADASEKKETGNTGFDYTSMTTATLLRHKKVMIDTESYMEASKIQKELDARGGIIL